MSTITAIVISRKVEDVINNFEPRARLQSVRCYPNYDKNAYDVSIGFYIINAPTELVELDIMLERLR
jgi:predicted component of type VI protein secretion system